MMGYSRDLEASGNGSLMRFPPLVLKFFSKRFCSAHEQDVRGTDEIYVFASKDRNRYGIVRYNCSTFRVVVSGSRRSFETVPFFLQHCPFFNLPNSSVVIAHLMSGTGPFSTYSIRLNSLVRMTQR